MAALKHRSGLHDIERPKNGERSSSGDRQPKATFGRAGPKPFAPSELPADTYGQASDPFLASFVFDDDKLQDHAPDRAKAVAAAEPVEMRDTPVCEPDAPVSGLPASDDGSGLTANGRQFCHLPLRHLHPGPNRLRRDFNQQDLQDLAQSIREKGLLQPLIVRSRPHGQYEIVAGERRWRAARLAGIREVPVLLRELSDAEALEIALVENVQRSDLGPLEEAEGYAQLMQLCGYTQHRLASVVGKSRSHVANSLRLLTLPDEVKAHLEAGRLTPGHARTLVAAVAPLELADQIIKRNLNVRDSERLARAQHGSSCGRKAPQRDRGDFRELERQVSEALGLKVEIVGVGRSTGRVVVHVPTVERLNEVCRRLTRQD
jgi:ParB family transcriptional regulator, chromosome partitioning protein